jgi:hypothetical protein
MAPDPHAKSEQQSVVRSIVSLLIVIHFSCVFTVLFANFRRSRLQGDLVNVFRPYTEFFSFDPDFTPFYLTHGGENDDRVIVVELYPRGDAPVATQELLKTVVLPDRGTKWFGDRRRYFGLANVLAFYGESEQTDDLSAEVARAVGRRLMDENGAKAAVVRSVQRMSQPMDRAALLPGFPPNDPTDPRYDVVIYEADVFYDEDGQVQVNKRAGRGEVAPRQGAPSTSAAPANRP